MCRDIIALLLLIVVMVACSMAIFKCRTHPLDKRVAELERLMDKLPDRLFNRWVK